MLVGKLGKKLSCQQTERRSHWNNREPAQRRQEALAGDVLCLHSSRDFFSYVGKDFLDLFPQETHISCQLHSCFIRGAWAKGCFNLLGHSSNTYRISVPSWGGSCGNRLETKCWVETALSKLEPNPKTVAFHSRGGHVTSTHVYAGANLSLSDSPEASRRCPTGCRCCF